MIKKLQSTLSQFVTMFCITFALTATITLHSGTVNAAENLQVKNDIINLMLCYGAGTDSFGVASNPNSFSDGLAIYEACFTDDAVFNLWPAGFDFNGPPLLSINGPLNWANFVAGGLNGDSLGQHMLTNFIVDVNENTGTLQAYLNSTRATNNDVGTVTQVVVANGTYTLTVEKIESKWMVTQLDLRLISFVPTFIAP
jgi:hypothetical protein